MHSFVTFCINRGDKNSMHKNKTENCNDPLFLISSYILLIII